jgi:hypothetical protein
MITGILAAYLITTLIEDYFLAHRGEVRLNKYYTVLIGMAVVVIIYYPLFTKIDKWSTSFSKKFIQAGKKISGKRTGALLAFIIAFLILYYFLMKMWYDTDLIRVIAGLM